MGSKRQNQRKKKSSSRSSSTFTDRTRPPCRFHIFQTLISAFGSSDSEGLKLPLMKSLYCLLSQLSLKMPICFSEDGTSLNYLDMEFNQDRFEVGYTDLLKISDLFFKELEKKFGCYLSAVFGIPVTEYDGKTSFHLDLSTDLEELTLLLRCCMVMLTLFESDQTLLLKKCQVLLSILSRILSLTMAGRNETNSICLRKKSASLSICTLLEVFADELLMHKSLREYLMLVDSTSDTSKVLFACHFGPGNIGSVLEVISCHFILHFSGEQAFEDFFLNSLFWQHGKGLRVPELSLTAALSLLLDPNILSAPKLFQAHIILLVSEVINNGMSFESFRPDISLVSLYMTAFEKSVILYTRHMSGMYINGPRLDANSSFVKSLGRNCQPSFEYYVQEGTRDKICYLVTKSNDILDSDLCNKFSRMKSELVAESIACMEEYQHVLDEPCKEKILSILGCIIRRASDDDVNDAEMSKKWDTSPQDTCLLASILKLMGGSLLQAVWCTRYIRNLGCPETLKGSTSCKDYEFILDIVRCFQDFKVFLPVQEFLCDVMKSQPMKHKEKHKEFKWILVHFSGLLSLSFVRGPDYLVKNCVFMMMTLLNLLSLEEGYLATLKPVLDSESEFCLRKLSSVQVREAQSSSKSTRKVPLNFQRIQRVHLSCNSLKSSHQNARNRQAKASGNIHIQDQNESVLGVEEETDTTCNGEIYLNYIAGNSHKLYDFDDLADFVECKKGKNYSAWFKVRQQYRTWKERKMAGFRQKKMRRMWKFIKGKKF